MSIYFRSSLGIDFPKSPYIGQIHYDPDLKRTFRYKEKDLYFEINNRLVSLGRYN